MTNEELAVLIQEGDTGLMPKLWEQLRKLITLHAKKFLARCSDEIAWHTTLEDLQQAGFFALREAVRYYDPRRDLKLSTYLVYNLRNAFRKECGIRRREDPMLRYMSLNSPVGEDGDELLNLLEDPASNATIELFEESEYNRELRAVLDAALDDLPSGWASAIRSKYYYGMSIDEIAQERGISKQAVSDMIKNGLSRMRYGKHGRSLYEFMFHESIGTEYLIDGGKQEVMDSLLDEECELLV